MVLGTNHKINAKLCHLGYYEYDLSLYFILNFFLCRLITEEYIFDCTYGFIDIKFETKRYGLITTLLYLESSTVRPYKVATTYARFFWAPFLSVAFL